MKPPNRLALALTCTAGCLLATAPATSPAKRSNPQPEVRHATAYWYPAYDGNPIIGFAGTCTHGARLVEVRIADGSGANTVGPCGPLDHTVYPGKGLLPPGLVVPNGLSRIKVLLRGGTKKGTVGAGVPVLGHTGPWHKATIVLHGGYGHKRMSNWNAR
ncbi:MAG: hypothetical protein QOG33_845 [Gaiellales bacterium]|jgi:hypothetical protein|nr:hypothetical protein [Gaiellales bacterium]